MIKWFDSKFISSMPRLTDTRGGLVDALNALLVNGFNPKSVISLSYDNGVCTLDVGVGHGFIKHSVIVINSSEQVALNNLEFRVDIVKETTIGFKVATPIANEAGLLVKYAALGFEQHFNSDGRSCYKSPNPEYPAYLRVDDKTQFTTSSTHSKFAGVELCLNMTDFDTAEWQAPYDAANPLRNRKATDKTGWFKWYYAANNVANNSVVPFSAERRYMLVGNSDYFWLIIYPYGLGATDSGYAAVYGFALVDYGDRLQQSLIATNVDINPHISFINAHTPENGTVVVGSNKTYCALPSNPLRSIKTQSNVNFEFAIFSFDKKLLFRDAIYLYDGLEIKARFSGITTSSINMDGDNILSVGAISRIASTGQYYALALDLE